MKIQTTVLRFRMVTEPKGDIQSSHLTKMTVPDMTIKYLSEATDHQLTRLPNSIAVTNGHLILDGNLVDHVAYMNEDKLSWTRQTSWWSVASDRYLIVISGTVILVKREDFISPFGSVTMRFKHSPLPGSRTLWI
jgi:hypothetical protein